MIRLEIIHLRLMGNPPQDLVDDIRRTIATEPGLEAVRFYHNATIGTDLGVHIFSRVDDLSEARPSALGIRLVAALRENGMVEHTIWNGEVDRVGRGLVVRLRDFDQLSPALTPAGVVARRLHATSMRSPRSYPAVAMTRRSTNQNP